MKKVLGTCVAGLVMVAASQAAVITLIDSTLTGGNGGFEYPGAKTTANGWQAGNGYIRQYVDTDSGHASDQKPFNGGTADAWNDTIIPGWTITSPGATAGFDSRLSSASGGTQMFGGVNNITAAGDPDMVNDTYIFGNGDDVFIYSDDFTYSFNEGDELHFSFYSATRDANPVGINIRMGNAVNKVQNTLENVSVATGAIGQIYTYDYTVQAGDDFANWTNIGFKITGGLQSSIDDVSFSVTSVVPEPATLGLLGLAFGGLIMMRRRK